MYSQQRNRPTPSNNAARLAAEAAFSAPPAPEKPPESVSNALIVVKKKRSIDPADGANSTNDEIHGDDVNRAPRVFRVSTAAFPELDGHPSGAMSGDSHAANASLHGAARFSSNDMSDEDRRPAAHRRSRRTSVARSGPVVTIVAAPAHEPVDLAALAIELEASMNAKAHAAAEAQLSRLQAQLNALEPVLSVIAKARDFTLSDMQLSTRWQQLDLEARRLAEIMP